MTMRHSNRLRACTTAEALVDAFHGWLDGIQDARVAIDNRGAMVPAFVAAIAK